MATETLRPDAAGDECNLSQQIGASCPDHYQNVYEVVSDDDTTIVGSNAASYERDLYNIAASGVGAGTINEITVWVNAKNWSTDLRESLKICISTGDTPFESAEKHMTTSYALYSNTWTENPDTELAWTWDDISSLQIGVALRYARSGYVSRCTQVWVEIDYEEGAPPVTEAYGYVV